MRDELCALAENETSRRDGQLPRLGMGSLKALMDALTDDGTAQTAG
jgi:hypothetical protein